MGCGARTATRSPSTLPRLTRAACTLRARACINFRKSSELIWIVASKPASISSWVGSAAAGETAFAAAFFVAATVGARLGDGAVAEDFVEEAVGGDGAPMWRSRL